MFPQMVNIVPPGEKGIAKVDHFEVSKEDSLFTRIRAMRNPDEYVPAGKYARLHVAKQLMMTDTPMEQRSNWRIGSEAHGKVLIAGLGIGMVLAKILAMKEVKAVMVVEKYQDVIDVVGPHFKSRKLTLINGDIFEWKPTKGTKFDVIYFDIWAERCDDNLAEMAKLHRRFARCLNRENPKAWMDSWFRDRLIAERRRYQRNGW